MDVAIEKTEYLVANPAPLEKQKHVAQHQSILALND